MTCVHLQKLYQLCQKNDIKLSGADLVHMVCQQCGVQEKCPSALMDEYEAAHPDHESEEASEGAK